MLMHAKYIIMQENVTKTMTTRVIQLLLMHMMYASLYSVYTHNKVPWKEKVKCKNSRPLD